MNFKVEFWDDERTAWDSRWFDSIEKAIRYIEGLKKLESITSIELSQILLEFEV